MAQKTVTAVGNAQIDTAQFKYGAASGLFDGTGDYLTIDDNTDFEFGSGDFTIDTWIRLNAALAEGVNNVIVSHYTGASRGYIFTLQKDSGVDKLKFFESTSGSDWDAIYSNNITVSTNTWYHFAVTRTGGKIYFFQDGTLLNAGGTNDTATIYDAAFALEIGGSSPATNYLNGWMDELRVTKGLARWTANFTPPDITYYDSNDVLRLHFEGSDTSTTFTDSSADTVDVAPVTAKGGAAFFNLL